MLRLHTSASGHEVAGVVAQIKGETRVFSGDIVVVSCGAVNSAALLLRSANEQHPRGLANNSSGLVGRNLMKHVLGSLIAVVGVAFASRVRNARRSRGEKELDQIIERVGGRLDRLKGRTRKRLRDSLRREIGEVESGPRAKQMVWEAAAAALTSAATLLASRFATRVVADDELPEDTRR